VLYCLVLFGYFLTEIIAAGNQAIRNHESYRTGNISADSESVLNDLRKQVQAFDNIDQSIPYNLNEIPNGERYIISTSLIYILFYSSCA